MDILPPLTQWSLTRTVIFLFYFSPNGPGNTPLPTGHIYHLSLSSSHASLVMMLWRSLCTHVCLVTIVGCCPNLSILVSVTAYTVPGIEIPIVDGVALVNPTLQLGQVSELAHR